MGLAAGEQELARPSEAPHHEAYEAALAVALAVALAHLQVFPTMDALTRHYFRGRHEEWLAVA